MRHTNRSRHVSYLKYLNTLNNIENKGYHLIGQYRTEQSFISKKATPKKIDNLMSSVKSKYKNVKKININGITKIYVK